MVITWIKLEVTWSWKTHKQVELVWIKGKWKKCIKVNTFNGIINSIRNESIWTNVKDESHNHGERSYELLNLWVRWVDSREWSSELLLWGSGEDEGEWFRGSRKIESNDNSEMKGLREICEDDEFLIWEWDWMVQF